MSARPWLLVTAGFTAAAALTAISARLAAPAGASVRTDAVAYHGAMQVYGGIARWAGRRALHVEHLYWKAIAQ